MKLNVLLGDAYKEGMTADEIISALEKVADPNAEVEKLRNAVTKANGEAAEYKKQLKAKRTDDENAAQEQADKLAEMQKQIEALTADKENLVKEKTLVKFFLIISVGNNIVFNAGIRSYTVGHTVFGNMGHTHLSDFAN